MIRNLGLVTLSLAGLSILALPSVSVAGIKCQGNYQISKYGPIATPYCEEQQIANVARSYGWKVTDKQVRNDALKKVYICQILGHDVRLKGSCAGYGPDAYSGGP